MGVSSLIDRGICVILGHAWSGWLVGRAVPLTEPKWRDGWEHRFCWRCDRDEERQVPEPARPPIPVHEPAPVIAEAGRYEPRPAPPGELTPAPWIRDLASRAVPVPVVGTGTVVVNRDRDEPDEQSDTTPVAMPGWLEEFARAPLPFPLAPPAFVTEPAAKPAADLQRQLEATREMLADLGRQLDEVTLERDQLRKQRAAAWPTSVVDLERDFGIARQQLLEITRDRDRLSEVSGRRLEHTRALLAQLQAARTIMSDLGGVGPNVLAAFDPPAELGESWRDGRPQIPRPDRC